METKDDKNRNDKPEFSEDQLKELKDIQKVVEGYLKAREPKSSGEMITQYQSKKAPEDEIALEFNEFLARALTVKEDPSRDISIEGLQTKTDELLKEAKEKGLSEFSKIGTLLRIVQKICEESPGPSGPGMG